MLINDGDSFNAVFDGLMSKLVGGSIGLGSEKI